MCHGFSAPTDFYPSSSGVVNLDERGFEDMLESDEPYFVEFYAPWCPHCKNLKSDYEMTARGVGGRVKVAAVDCEANKSGAGMHCGEGLLCINLARQPSCETRRDPAPLPLQSAGTRASRASRRSSSS